LGQILVWVGGGERERVCCVCMLLSSNIKSKFQPRPEGEGL
jgi:hypothetical protein